MPGARGQGERRLEAAIADLARALDASGAPWMIIGGIAVIARGVRRMTADVDAVVQGDAVDVDALLKRLARWRIVPRIEDIATFARANLVLLLRHRPSSAKPPLDGVRFVHVAGTPQDLPTTDPRGSMTILFGQGISPITKASLRKGLIFLAASFQKAAQGSSVSGQEANHDYAHSLTRT